MATIGAPTDVDSDLTSQTDSVASANGIDHAEMENQLAGFVAQMEPVKPGVIRAVPAHLALRRFGQVLRKETRISADVAFETNRIDEFWSHSWHGGKVKKVLTAFYVQNGRTAMFLATLVCFFLMALIGAGFLPPRFQEAPFRYPASSGWISATGFVLYCGLLVFWRPWHSIFLDVLCINQHNEQEKADSIVSMGAFLKSSDSLLVLWDSSYCHRLWCIFELAGYLHSRPANAKSKLCIRPTILGPCFISIPVAMGAIVIILGFLPWMALEDLTKGPHGIDVVAILWPTTGVLMFVGFYFSTHTLRSYLRSVEELQVQLCDFKVGSSLCWCCSVEHKMPDGQEMICDRRIVCQCISQWFGSLEKFNQKVQEEVAEPLLSQLSQDVFTFPHFAISALPVLWHFMDASATVMYYNDLRLSRSLCAAIREFVRGLGWAFGVVPILFFVASRLSFMFRRKCSWMLCDIFVNCFILLVVIGLFNASLIFEDFCWELDILEMQNVGPYELLPGSGVFSLTVLALALLLFSCRYVFERMTSFSKKTEDIKMV